MAYDKLSFLSGVAAGRNMESWPAFEGGGLLDIFAYEVEIDGTDRGYTSYSWQVAFAHGGQILWGDGTQDTITPTSNLNWYSHIYNETGIYTVIIIGGSYFAYAPGDFIKRVLTPLPNATAYVYRMFDGCTYLETIPDGFLKHVSCGTDYYHFMHNCYRLKSIPEDLFQYHSPTSLVEAFMGAGELNYYSGTEEPIALPPLLLSGCTQLYNAVGAFSGYFGDIPTGFMNDCESLEAAGGEWSFPTGMFAYSRGETIPDGLLDNCQNLRNAEGMFEWMQNLKSIPSTLFDNCPIESFRGCFSRCSNVEGNVPELWITHPNADGTGCYNGCVKAANYADIPDDWK